jgi:preprotein translocase subunit SecD
MRQRTYYFLIAIVALTLAAILVDLAGTAGNFKVFGRGTPVHEGLDLVGGLSMDLEAVNHKQASSDAMSAAIDVITKRVNALGVSEPQVTKLGNYGIDVEIPGVKDPEQVRKTIGSTGQLVLYGMGTLPVLAQGAKFTYKTTTFCNVSSPPSPCVVLNGNELDSSGVGSSTDQFGAPIVTFATKGGASDRLSSYTTAHVGEYMAFVLDGSVITDPKIQTAITGGNGEINGIGTTDEAKSIAVQIKYGSLPIAFSIAASNQISATLGPQYVHDSVLAGVIGLAIVIFFMVTYYRLPGLLADVALLIFATTTFAVFKLIPVTLTLAGIAGFILTVGMAVDANILIFERLKEELRSGKTLGAAIEAGFNRAWTSIRDSNISTMITCCVLYWFGQNYGASSIAGFALTLGIGVAISMFTAIVITRTFLRAIVGTNSSFHPKWFGAGLDRIGPASRAGRGVTE